MGYFEHIEPRKRPPLRIICEPGWVVCADPDHLFFLVDAVRPYHVFGSAETIGELVDLAYGKERWKAVANWDDAA